MAMTWANQATSSSCAELLCTARPLNIPAKRAVSVHPLESCATAFSSLFQFSIAKRPRCRSISLSASLPSLSVLPLWPPLLHHTVDNYSTIILSLTCLDYPSRSSSSAFPLSPANTPGTKHLHLQSRPPRTSAGFKESLRVDLITSLTSESYWDDGLVVDGKATIILVPHQ